MSSSGSVTPAAPPPGAFSPFAHAAFALLWTATLVSNTGTWMHEVGAGWLMTTLDPRPAMVTLVQAATTLPVFLFALLAGAIADRVDKRALLIALNTALFAMVSVLAVLVWCEVMTPALLILFTFGLGTGAAFMAPAWQSVVPQLIPRAKLTPAIALNSMGLNLSRAIGPALAGLLIARVGLAAPFALNAVSYLVILAALFVWRPAPAPPPPGHGTILGDMRTGLRHVRHNAPMRATAIRAVAFFLFASAYWALLPLIARRVEGGGAELYGALMGVIGAGAVTGALLLPRVQAHITSDRTVRIGTGGSALALVMMGLGPGQGALLAAAFLGGLSWIAVLTAFHVSAQTALPDWVRARGLSVFLMVFFGAMAFGSLVWGQVAQATSVPITLLIAAGGLLAGMALTRRFVVGQGEALDLSQTVAWPAAPILTGPQSHDSPALVTVEYVVDPDQTDAFLAAIGAFSRARLRDGATHWHLHESVERPGLWIESFHLPSWAEHLAQHARLTREDDAAQKVVQAFDTSDTGPVVRHYVARALP